MRILITGGLGQLGRSLEKVLVDHELLLIDLPEHDITDGRQMLDLAVSWRPDLIIHCAAYTNVDGAARDPDIAYQVNTLGAKNVALAAVASKSAMVHLSTNEVFPGEAPAGYGEWDPTHPINAYGQSKAASEELVRKICDRSYIVRTAWLYASGGKNFIHAIIERAKEGSELRVVVDEVGNPTYVNDLAQAIESLIFSGQFGTYHLTNSGFCSRWSFAREILRLSGLGHVPVVPILSKDYRRSSTPPPYAGLRNLNGAEIGITLRGWREALAEYIHSYG